MFGAISVVNEFALINIIDVWDVDRSVNIGLPEQRAGPGESEFQSNDRAVSDAVVHWVDAPVFGEGAIARVSCYLGR